MKYLVQFQFDEGQKDKAYAFFETIGPNRHPGVKFLGAWIGKDDDVAFALLECEGLEQLAIAGETWSQFGTHLATAVIDIEQY